MNLRMLLIFLPSKERRFIPICTATFCSAKSALINHMLKDFYYCYSSLKLETISAIFFSQFLDVIHPASSSSSLEEEEIFLFGFLGTEIHSYSSLLASIYCFYSFLAVQTGLVYCSFSSSYSSDSERSDISFSFAQSSRSSFSRMGGGSFLSFSSNPSCLQNLYATAISSISTCESVAISPVFFEKALTSSTSLSSKSTTSSLKGRFSMNSLVLRSLSSLMTSGVVTRRLLTARLVILLIEIKALASTIMIDFRSVCIVEYKGYQQKYYIGQQEEAGYNGKNQSVFRIILVGEEGEEVLEGVVVLLKSLFLLLLLLLKSAVDVAFELFYQFAYFQLLFLLLF